MESLPIASSNKAASNISLKPTKLLSVPTLATVDTKCLKYFPSNELIIVNIAVFFVLNL